MSRSIGLAARYIALVILGCSIRVSANAGSQMTLNGAQLLHACTKLDHEWIGFCNGYLQAAFDAAGKTVCVPVGTTRNDLFDKTIPRLREAGQHLEDDALPLVVGLLRAVYPCG